jgi:8-oxo-dGTP pyrophosphatase MutT (NUDIX family)
MENNKFYSVLVNAIIVNDGKILILNRSLDGKQQSESWTIPAGKIESYEDSDEVFNIIEKTLIRKVKEEVGIEISENVRLIANNTSRHSNFSNVLSLAFLCELKSGKTQGPKDSIMTAWISPREMNNYKFTANVREYIAKGFAFLPYMRKFKKPFQES